MRGDDTKYIVPILKDDAFLIDERGVTSGDDGEIGAVKVGAVQPRGQQRKGGLACQRRGLDVLKPQIVERATRLERDARRSELLHAALLSDLLSGPRVRRELDLRLWRNLDPGDGGLRFEMRNVIQRRGLVAELSSHGLLPCLLCGPSRSNLLSSPPN